ncbi:hypothetical protein CapIbe_014064 [Capra ibex]
MHGPPATRTQSPPPPPSPGSAQDPHEDAHQTPARDPAHFRSRPLPPVPYRHHFGPEPHRSWWRDDGREPGGGTPECGGRTVRGRGAQREAARRRRTCCKEVAGGGAACGSPELSVRAGAPASPEPTSGRAPPYVALSARR